MKLLRVGDNKQEKPAVIDSNGNIRDLSNLIADLNPKTINDKTLKLINDANINNFPIIENGTRIGACVSNPQKFIGIGLNFIDHAEETGAKPPNEPIVFIKTNNTISGPNDNVILPKNSIRSDWEVELGIIIGKEANYIKQKQSLDHIFGYCIVNDISERDYQFQSGQWSKGKCCNTFGPIGPYLVSKDEINNIQNLNMELLVNNRLMQKGNTNKMIFNVKYLVSYLSHYMTLYPGDIITTGTPPGVGMAKKPPIYLKSGDIMTLKIDNLGTQKQKVV
jgi:2-keto-4-pentenoate hydratase/2-oxohepta-3-ene-1,7-dioic acid hydratase in catechol pathway